MPEEKINEQNKRESQSENRSLSDKNIVKTEITDEMEKAYIDYAMSVIVSRALPSVEDGLKPVQRRILYIMHLMGLRNDKQTKKCARIVGDTIGKVHPHGDTAIYDALVRMAQDFSLRYPLIQGQGNFGSLDGDPPAAYRYTEAKLAKISSEILQDIDKETVKFLPNFDNSLKEPVTLPAKLPTLLLNGATGIAVGMATNVPPHNLTEVCDAIIAYINKPEISIEKLCRIIKGPDFPTGGYITSGEIEDIYKTGKGRVIIRGKVTTEEYKGKQRIVITEIPYMLNKSTLVEQIAKLVQARRLPDVSDIRDESSKGKIRIVIDLRKGADSKFTINRLYKFTRLQDRFDANIIALVNGKPQVLNLKKIIENYVYYRKIIITKRCKYELKKALDRQEIVLGLLKALKDIDNIVQLIKKSQHTTQALDELQKKYSLTKVQAQAILEMKLQQLTSLEQSKLKKESDELKIKIAELQKILANEQEILSIIKKEVNELKRKYGDSRRTQILQRFKEISEKDLVQKKQVVITITEKGYVKRMGLRVYREQKRGGKGVIGSDLTTGDFVKHLITCSTHDYLLFFTKKGKVYWLKAYQIPQAQRYSKGQAIINLLKLRDDSVQNVIAVKKFENYLIMTTKLGIVKKMPLEILSKPRSTGVKVINLPQHSQNHDFLISARLIKENQEILLVTKKGKAIRFNSDEIRSMTRASYGVTGIKLEQDDKVVNLEVLPKKGEKTKAQANTILTITEKGYGKRSNIEDYRLTARAGKGVINLKISEKTGEVVTTVSAIDKDSVIITTAKGMVMRTAVKNLRVIGRATQGVRIVKLQHGDKVTDLVKVPVAKEVGERE